MTDPAASPTLQQLADDTPAPPRPLGVKPFLPSPTCVDHQMQNHVAAR